MYLIVFGQNAVPGPPMAQIELLIIQQGGIDLTGRTILKAFTVKEGSYLSFFCLA
jgi:hypothetical protein